MCNTHRAITSWGKQSDCGTIRGIADKLTRTVLLLTAVPSIHELAVGSNVGIRESTFGSNRAGSRILTTEWRMYSNKKLVFSEHYQSQIHKFTNSQMTSYLFIHIFIHIVNTTKILLLLTRLECTNCNRHPFEF